MKKLKLNLAHEAGEILSKEEMKMVTGGSTNTGSGKGAKFSCTCNPPGIGAWTGTYSSWIAIASALDNYCEFGGSCINIG